MIRYSLFWSFVLFWFLFSRFILTSQYEINNFDLRDHPVSPLVGPQPPLVQEAQCCQSLVAALPDQVDS